MNVKHSRENNEYDLIIIVDDIDAIKVWTEQIECALEAVQPHLRVARSGISHFDPNKNRFKKSKKLLFMLDVKHKTYQSRLMDEWLRHFDGLRAKDILCVLVNNSQENVLDLEDVEKGNFNIIKSHKKTDHISNFHNWWPPVVHFLFLDMKESRKCLRYDMQNVSTHPDEILPQRLRQCLDAFVQNQGTDGDTKYHTVKVIGQAGNDTGYERDYLHVVIASNSIQHRMFSPCSSVHARTEVLRCVLFVLKSPEHGLGINMGKNLNYP